MPTLDFDAITIGLITPGYLWPENLWFRVFLEWEVGRFIFGWLIILTHNTMLLKQMFSGGVYQKFKYLGSTAEDSNSADPKWGPEVWI